VLFRSLTLVEVVAGLVLLATLLASILVAFGGHAAQIRVARDRLTAIDAADRLLTEWMSRNVFPAVGTEQSLAGTEGWNWRLVANETANVSAGIQQPGVASVRLDVFRTKDAGQVEVLASVDLVGPGKSAIQQ
jgi:hypothetical protein